MSASKVSIPNRHFLLLVLLLLFASNSGRKAVAVSTTKSTKDQQVQPAFFSALSWTQEDDVVNDSVTVMKGGFSLRDSSSLSSLTKEYQSEKQGVHRLHGTVRRRMQGESERGRTVLTFLYLSVLGMCFMTPVLYYFRLHCEERGVQRRLQALEDTNTTTTRSRRGPNGTLVVIGGSGGLAGASFSSSSNANPNNNTNSEESRAARRKYLAERKARIVQLIAPVRVVRGTLDARSTVLHSLPFVSCRFGAISYTHTCLVALWMTPFFAIVGFVF